MEVTLKTYVTLIKTSAILRSARNSIYITIVGTAINMVSTALFAYPLSKDYIKARGIILKLVVFTMLFGGGMIPNYILVRNLGLIDTFWAVMIPGAISQFNLIVLVNFFKGIPKELEESARIDGWTTLIY